jgi:hypothetical protein
MMLVANEHPPGLTDFSAPPRWSEKHDDFRRRSVSQPAPPSHSKSVAFNLDEQPPAATHGHERYGPDTDDSDSTIDGTDQRRHRHRHRHRRSSVPDALSASHHRPGKPGARNAAKDSDSDSESTVDLPDRFDADGRRLPDKDQDPMATAVEELLHNVFSEGKPKSRSRSKIF